MKNNLPRTYDKGLVSRIDKRTLKTQPHESKQPNYRVGKAFSQKSRPRGRQMSNSIGRRASLVTRGTQLRKETTSPCKKGHDKRQGHQVLGWWAAGTLTGQSWEGNTAQVLFQQTGGPSQVTRTPTMWPTTPLFGMPPREMQKPLPLYKVLSVIATKKKQPNRPAVRGRVNTSSNIHLAE